jgi:hypothetical protein
MDSENPTAKASEGSHTKTSQPPPTARVPPLIPPTPHSYQITASVFDCPYFFRRFKALSLRYGLRFGNDLLALPASRLGGGLKVSFARNALTRRTLAPNMVARGAGLFQ